MPSLTYLEFQQKTFPEKSAFHRKRFDFFTNLVRWIAMRFAYFLFLLRIPGNAVDVFGILLPFTGFVFLSTALSGEKLLPAVGALMIFFHVFLDFVDGPISRASGASSKIGACLDDWGCDVDRCAVFILLGIFTQSTLLLILSIFTAGVAVFFIPHAYVEMPKSGWVGWICKAYVHKYSFLSVRVMLGLLPLFLVFAVFRDWDLQALAWVLSLFYISMITLWLLLCVPSRYRS